MMDQAAADGADVGGPDMSVNADQQDFWSNAAGDKWVAQQAAMDTLLAPVLDLVLDTAALQSGDHVLDIGCGAGTSTAQAAAIVGATGHAKGADISAPLLSHAQNSFKAANLSWLHADAQTHSFAPQQFDAMISRFGVMFFANTTDAFANIRKSLKPNAEITMAAWGPAADNPWFMDPAKAARAQLGPMPKTDRTLPGPFAFEDPARTITQLTTAGLYNVTCTTHQLALTSHGDAKAAADLCCVIGPADRAIAHFDATPAQQRDLRDTIAAQFETYQSDAGLQIPASIHLYQATC